MGKKPEDKVKTGLTPVRMRSLKPQSRKAAKEIAVPSD